MTVTELTSSTADESPPDIAIPLQALWWDAKGDWKRAHETCQVDEGADGAWVHAYLHRKDGDLSNAAYWYQRAGRPVPTGSLDTEWENIAAELLGPLPG